MPYPSSDLYPSPNLYPGLGDPSAPPASGPVGFTGQILDAISPWSDPQGFWDTYNAALAAMFEPIYDIVADTGDPNQTIVGVLSAALSTATTITSISVEAVSVLITSGTEITLSYATSTQTLISAGANAGDQSIGVALTVPNFAYPIGTPVQLTYTPGWSILLDPYNCPDRLLPYLAEFSGTDVPVGLDARTIRLKIIYESALQRGTTSSIISAVKRNLVNTQTVAIQERLNTLGTMNAYWFIVIVRPEEVANEQSLIDDVNLAKPGGVQWTLILSDAPLVSQYTRLMSAVTVTLDAATLADVT